MALPPMMGGLLVLCALLLVWGVSAQTRLNHLRRLAADATLPQTTTTPSNQAPVGTRLNDKALAQDEGEPPAMLPGRDEVLAIVSHELRTPLTSILGYIEMLQQRVTDTESQAIIAKVTRNAQALVGLIDAMLDLSRLNAGRLEMTILPVHLQECLEEAYERVAPLLQAKGLAFELSIPDRPLVVNGSFERLQQVFANLLGNAVKFTSEGTISVTVASSERCVEIRVSDTGIGIAPEHLPHIFDQFSQADASIRRRFGGSGLGLAISSRLIAMHQGRLYVQSTLGQGSTFIVELPTQKTRSS